MKVFKTLFVFFPICVFRIAATTLYVIRESIIAAAKICQAISYLDCEKKSLNKAVYVSGSLR